MSEGLSNLSNLSKALLVGAGGAFMAALVHWKQGKVEAGKGKGQVNGDDLTLLIDNYDSFTYNIFQYLSELGGNVMVVRNDVMTVEELVALNPARVVVSPGPGHPRDAGVSMEAVRAFAGRVPVLGVCLGHQAIVEVFGGKVVVGPEIVHGKVSPIQHDSRGVFHGLPQDFDATRYHSLIADPDTIPSDLEVSASCVGKEHPNLTIIQGVRHRRYCVEGVQFHPESIKSEAGKQLLANFLSARSAYWDE